MITSEIIRRAERRLNLLQAAGKGKIPMSQQPERSSKGTSPSSFFSLFHEPIKRNGTQRTRSVNSPAGSDNTFVPPLNDLNDRAGVQQILAGQLLRIDASNKEEEEKKKSHFVLR